MTLDILGGVLCGWVAWCMFLLYSFTAHRHDRWFNLPRYVRVGLWITGAMFAYRSVNFLTLPGGPIVAAGHINVEGLIALCGLTYLVSAVAVHSGVFEHLPPKSWSRLHWAKEQAKDGLVPVMMEPAKVADLAREEGFIVNRDVMDIPPPEKRH